MATTAAQALLEEYVSEVRERIEDEKNYIRTKQGVGLLRSANRIFGFACKAFSVVGFLLLCVVAGNLSEADLHSIAAASASEIEAGIDFMLFLFVGVFALALGASIVVYRSYFFTDERQAYLDREQAELERVKTIVSVCDELLTRHRLINQEGVDNG